MKTRHHKPNIAIALAAIAFTANAPGAIIASFGNVSGTQVTDWRTTTTTKTLDIDGNNRYGTYGAVHWGVATANLQTLGSATPGIAITRAVTGAGTAIAAGYTDIDHVNSFPANADAGIAFGAPATLVFELTGIASTYVGQTIRVGVMHDVLALAERAGDTFKGLSIVQTVGIGTGNTSGVIPLRAGGGGDGVPEMYFFDITNAVAGNRFELRGLNNVGGTSGSSNAGYLAPVSFDIVPEPSSALLGGLGMLALLRRRR